MDKKKLAAYKEKLEDIKQSILQKMNNLKAETLNKSQRDSSGDLSGYSFHMADVGTDNYEREFSLTLAANDLDVLHKIEDAMVRIDEGVFGTCLMCEDKIPAVRLDAVPYAEFCLKCKGIQEKHQRARR